MIKYGARNPVTGYKIGMRSLYRNQVIIETDDVRAVFEYMLVHIDYNVDGGELQNY